MPKYKNISFVNEILCISHDFIRYFEANRKKTFAFPGER